MGFLFGAPQQSMGYPYYPPYGYDTYSHNSIQPKYGYSHDYYDPSMYTHNQPSFEHLYCAQPYPESNYYPNHNSSMGYYSYPSAPLYYQPFIYQERK